MRIGFAAVACLLLGTASAFAQPAATRDPRPFRTGVDAVEIDVRVIDAQGNPVTGLTRDDFELFEDGVRQQVKAFTAVDVPVARRAAAGPALEPDVQSNAVPFDGRLYVLVLDDLHTHPLQANRVKRAVRRFLEEHVADNDRAALLVTSGNIDASQELTSSRAALLRALDRFHGRKIRSSTLERIDYYYMNRDTLERRENGRLRVDDPLESERAHNARLALGTLETAARWLGSVPARRKALLFVSEGIDYDVHDVFENRNASSIVSATRDVIAAASRGNVTIYGIDPRGLTMGDDGMEIASLPEDTSLNLGTSSMTAEVQRSQDSLRTLSGETGGFALVSTNDLTGGFDRIVRENSRYYVLGYEPTNTRRDGRFRKIDVRVRQSAGSGPDGPFRVEARRGYVAPKGEETRRAEAREETAPDLRALLESPLPVSGLPLTSSIAAFRGADGKASTLVALEVGPQFTFTDFEGLHRDRVDVSVLAIAADGSVTGGDQRAIELKLKPETVARVQRHGFRTLSRLQLAPGRYQVRIAAREQGGDRWGSVVHDLIVPDYAAPPVALSHLVLGSKGAAQAMTTRPDPELNGRLFVPPTAARRFSPGDTLTVFGEVYDNRAKGSEALTVVTTVSGSNGQAAFRAEEPVDAFALDAARKSWTHRVDVPLADLTSGEYVVRVEVKPRSAASPSVSREVAFRVGPDPKLAT